MKQNTNNADLKKKELLCTSLGFVTSLDHLNQKEESILKKSSNQDYMPLSLIEQAILNNQTID